MFRTTNPIQQPKRSFRIKWSEVAAFTAICAVVVTGTAVITNTALGASTSPSNDVTPACATDGSEATSESVSSNRSTNCFWNADSQGNGTGDSFYVDEAGQVYYLPGTECTDNLKAWTRDAQQVIEDMDSRWASSAPYSDSVHADNIDPMTSRLDYVLNEVCK